MKRLMLLTLINTEKGSNIRFWVCKLESKITIHLESDQKTHTKGRQATRKIS